MLPLSSVWLIIVAIVLSAANLIDRTIRPICPVKCYLHYVWMFFVVFIVADVFSVQAGVWILAFLSFVALREYFTLINIRMQDRLGILGAYLSIPFMYYFIQIEWYGMFIISIPVYSFLVIPLLIALGGKEARGTVFSVGVIVFGMFMFIYCMGHIGYLMLFSTWKAGLLVLSVAICDMIAHVCEKKIRSGPVRLLLRYCAPLPFVVGLALALSPWSGIPPRHSVNIGFMVPMLAVMGHRTISYIEADLGIKRENMLPGQGQIINNTASFLYAAPVFFHYIRYFLT